MLSGGLAAIKSRTDQIVDLRSRGLMTAIELRDDDRASRTTRIHRALVRQGYILAQRPGLNVLRMDPSLTIEEKDIEGFLDVFEGLLHPVSGEPGAVMATGQADGSSPRWSFAWDHR
jgi:4-aminobutyrate aminotransferase-like enzyme